MTSQARAILTLVCPDAIGIVAAVSGFLASHGGFIVESQQHADLETGRFFMRVAFQPGEAGDLETLRVAFAATGERFGMDWQLSDADAPMRIVIAVSKGGHCLNDLLHRWRTHSLAVEIAAVVSNHNDLRGLTEWHGLPYVHLPVTAATRDAQEAKLLELFDSSGAELLVLARYMQVLSPGLTAGVSGRCINIHHSFLPSFKGAKPYHQAHARGVKLIGATAHYVTADLDEGPIIEQASMRVDHGHTAEDFVALGRDIEAMVLARAVRWLAERRVLANGAKMVVFRR